jgi:hypothetical protein
VAGCGVEETDYLAVRAISSSHASMSERRNLKPNGIFKKGMGCSCLARLLCRVSSYTEERLHFRMLATSSIVRISSIRLLSLSSAMR